MVVFLCPHIKFLLRRPVQVFDLSQLSFVMQYQIFAISFTNSEQIHFFGQQFCFVLLLGSQRVVRFLNQFNLFIDHLELALKLLLSRLQ